MISTKVKFLILIFPLSGILIAYFIKKTEPLIIVDPISGFNTKQFDTRLYTDSLTGGHSTLTLLKAPYNHLSYAYSLENKKNAPVVRLIIESKTKKLLDLSCFNQMSITLKSDKAKQIPIILCNAIPFHSSPEEINTYHLVTNYAVATAEFKKQELTLKEFTVPAWWYSFDSNKEYQNIKPEINLVKYLFVTNSSFSDQANTDTVTISEWRFEYEFTSFYIRSVIGVSLYYLLCFILYYFPKELGVETVYLWYKKIDTVNYEDVDKNRITTYLRNNFQNPELAITDVQHATGIHQRKISGILKRDNQLTFKAYVNQLRIEKAKTLLSETSLPISVIAFDCGYNNISHFNRVFKAELGISPQEFRINQMQPNS